MMAVLGAGPVLAQAPDALHAGFDAPGSAARPRVWWHWMNGNITKDGIGKDLAWFASIGIGGMTNFDGAGAIPRFVDRPLTFMSDGWKDAFRYAARTADSLGLELSVAASPGWSESGGPWVKPQAAMKKYVWTETWIEGGRRIHIALTRPSAVAGGFQDAAVTTRTKPAAFYRDARVFAYRVDPGARSQTALAPTVTANAAFAADGASLPRVNGRFILDLARLSDGKVSDPVYLAPTSEERPSWVALTYAAPVTMRGLTMATGEPFAAGWRPEAGPRVRVEASLDGATFRPIAEGLYTGAQRTFAFPATTARVFRVVILPATPPVVPRPGPLPRTPTRPGATKAPATPSAIAPVGFDGDETAPGRGLALAELVMRHAASVEQFEVKAGFGVVNDYYAIPTPATGRAVKPGDVLDLTSRLGADGVVDWQAPPGRWVVVRLGYGLTGKENGPASEEGTGLEVDKLNAGHVRDYIDTYLDMLASATGQDLIGAHGLSAILNDSYEARFQNWTEDMLEQFRARRGYDPGPYLPVLTGVVVGSAKDSDRFLWDWRRTISELLAQAHYKTLAEEARKRGLGSYAEALEDSRAYPGDDMEMRQYADVPMGAIGPNAFPQEGAQPPKRRLVDERGAASVAHVYGRSFVGSETFTGVGNDRMPEQIKSVADQAFLQGVNRVFIHTSAHQPTDQGPGVSLNNIGYFFSRNETWAGVAKPWIDFLARTSFMLQQGRYVADYAYFYGEEAPITGIWGGEPDKALPVGRGFDFVNADALLHQMSAHEGAAVTASGMRYPLIYIGGRSSRMSLPVLRKLAELVRAGVSIAGDRPVGSPSLADDDAAFQREADALWGANGPGVRLVGKGRVFVGFNADDALTRMGTFRDYDYTYEAMDDPIEAIHRSLPDGELYYVVNRRAWDVAVDVSFRTAGHPVEFWDPVTGKVAPAGYRTENGRTIVPLALNKAGSVFLVMRGSGPPARVAPQPELFTSAVLDGPWQVAFQPGRGAPATAAMPALTALSQSEDPGVRYFSGTAIYTKALELAEAPRAGRTYWLELGEVHDIARIVVNGVEEGVVWRPPFHADITGVLRSGRNDIRVEVTNSWKNRLIGDQQPGAVQVTFSPGAAEDAGTPLRPSGLIGPVRLVESR